MQNSSEENTVRRYRKVLTQCLHDLSYIKSNIILYNQIVTKEETFLHFNFFYFSAVALYNDTLTRSMRLLDKNRESSNFWYIKNIKEIEIRKYLDENNMSFENIIILSDKLIHIRNKIHFHVDKNGVLNPPKEWAGANIIGDFFMNTTDDICKILSYLYNIEFCEKYILYKYTGSEVDLIYDACRKSNNINKIFMPSVLHQELKKIPLIIKVINNLNSFIKTAFSIFLVNKR
jgi:DNA-dependent RNA polymerase auxiliary subunit epsilon